MCNAKENVLFCIRSNGVHGSQRFIVIAHDEVHAVVRAEILTGIPREILEAVPLLDLLSKDYNGIAELIPC